MGKLGIIVANTGSPDAPEPEAVKRYLREFLSDQRICPMNPRIWKIILNRCILPRRSVASAEKYRLIWTPQGSPLKVAMMSLARKLEAALVAEAGAENEVGAPLLAPGAGAGDIPLSRELETDAAGAGAPAIPGPLEEAAPGEVPAVRCAMSYGSPSLETALAELRQAGCDRLAVIPLYPQSAFSTTGAVMDGAKRTLGNLGWNPPLTEVDSYCGNPLYLAAIADSIRASGFDAAAGDRLLFAFHSIPLADIAAGDTYGDQAHATAEAVARELRLEPDEWAIGFQCRFDKSRRWLGPSTKDALKQLKGKEQGTEQQDGRQSSAQRPSGGRLFAVAPNFAVDCLETLYDIEVELRDAWQAAARASGAPEGSEATRLHYIPCLNDSDAQVRLLRSLVAKA